MRTNTHKNTKLQTIISTQHNGGTRLKQSRGRQKGLCLTEYHLVQLCGHLLLRVHGAYPQVWLIYPTRYHWRNLVFPLQPFSVGERALVRRSPVLLHSVLGTWEPGWLEFICTSVWLCLRRLFLESPVSSLAPHFPSFPALFQFGFSLGILFLTWCLELFS